MKNFIKFQLVLIVLLLSRSIKAQNWIYIAKNENGEKCFEYREHRCPELL